MARASTSRRQQQKVFSYCNSSDFLEVSQSPAFVDKTLFIKTLFESEFNYFFVVAPPGYGKSTNLDMVKRFVEIDVNPQTGRVSTFNKSKNYQIFKNNNLKIYQEQQFFNDHFAKFPVIYLSLKNIYAPTLELVMEKYAENLSKSFQQHQYLTQSKQLNGRERKLVATYTTLKTCQKLSKSQLQNGVQFLVEMLVKHYKLKEIIILIDDYDYPFIQYFIDPKSAVDSIMHLVFAQEMYASLTKSDSQIVRCLFMGRTEFSAFTKLIATETTECYALPMCHVFYEYFGLLPEEIITLSNRFNFNSNETIDTIINYYGVSTFNPEPICCTLSVMRYLEKRKFLDFRNTSEIFEMNNIIAKDIIYPSDYHLIDKLVAISDTKNNFMIRRDIANIDKCSIITLQFFRYYGYLNFKKISNYHIFCITSQFIRKYLKEIINDYYGSRLNHELERCAKIFNQISANAPRSVYFNFVEEYRKVAIEFSNDFPSYTYASIQCIADIIAKTKFVNIEPITINTNPNQICNLFLCDVQGGDLLEKTGLCLCVEDETPVESLLATAVELLIDYNTANAEVVSIGISTDTKFRFAIGWVVGKDLKNAQYFSFK